MIIQCHAWNSLLNSQFVRKRHCTLWRTLCDFDLLEVNSELFCDDWFKKKKNSTTCPLHIIFEDWMQFASLFSVNIIQLRGFSMSVPKDQPLVSDSMKKVGAVVTVSVAVLAAKHFWHCWWLNRKLEKKRESCRKTLQTVQQQLQQVLCWLHLLIFCYCVVLTACW